MNRTTPIREVLWFRKDFLRLAGYAPGASSVTKLAMMLLPRNELASWENYHPKGSSLLWHCSRAHIGIRSTHISEAQLSDKQGICTGGNGRTQVDSGYIPESPGLASSESPIMVTVLAQGSEGYYKMGEKKTALYWHDTVNVYALPVLGAACTLSLLGLLDGSIRHIPPSYRGDDSNRRRLLERSKVVQRYVGGLWHAVVTKLFLGYIAFDFAWIAIQPSTLPSLQGLILFHHAVTFLLLTFPYRNPAFSHFTCWDGITEINTFFLIARRQTRNFHRAFHWAYWLSFIPMRLIMYPVLLVQFWRVLEGYPWWDRGLVVVCQLMLCLFNYGMFWLSIRRRMVKRDPKRPPRPSAAAVPAAKVGKDSAEISGISMAQQNGHATNGTNGFKQESLKSR